MSNLPPYSTFRTDNKQMMYPQAISHGNILTFTPPGFTQSLNVKFPDCRLAVCEKCKKNYKTRDMCRVRNSHTTAPWTTAYICFTLDDTCTDADGAYLDKPLTVRMVQWQPFCVKKPFDPKTPVCSACKKTNRTRSFCRERHKHRQLPWCTVYVLLSALDSTDPSTVVAAPSKPVLSEDGGADSVKVEDGVDDLPSSNEDEKRALTIDDDADFQKALDDVPSPETAPDKDDTIVSDAIDPSDSCPPDGADAIAKEEETSPSPIREKTSTAEEGDESDNIHDISESRTFLAKVSCRGTSIHWLELSEFDATEGNSVHSLALVTTDNQSQAMVTMRQPGAIQAIDPNQAQYYANAMGYAAQQHQHALKSHQQYFFQMQQRQQQQYAAQQAAWQAQYNQQSQMQLTGSPGHVLQPTGNPGVDSQGAPTQGPPPGSSGPVTAGEAAAQQQKHIQNPNGAPMMPTGSPSQASQELVPVVQQQGQWQMMYQQQLYQQQMQMQQFQQPGGVMPQQVGAPQGQPGAMSPHPGMQLGGPPDPPGQQYGVPMLQGGSSQMENGMMSSMHGDDLGPKLDDMEPSPVHGMQESDENDAKRVRLV